MTRRCFASCLLLSACNRPSDESQIEKQLELRATYVGSMNFFGQASLFAEDGLLEVAGQPPVQGPKAIQQYLSTNSRFKVLDYSEDPQKPQVDGSKAAQTVIYQQHFRDPQGKSIELNGKLTISWSRSPEGRWLIQRLVTSSALQP